MSKKISDLVNPIIRTIVWLTGCAALLGAMCCAPANAETKLVTVEGSSEACWAKRETSLNFARTDARNKAHEECRALGLGWRFSGKTIPGYEQCSACGKTDGFKCKVTQETYACTNMQKENAEKAAKERAEKEEAVRVAKEKADREKSEREAQKKAAREKAERERAEKEAAAKVAKEKADLKLAERAAQKKAAKEKIERERAEKIAAAKMEKDKDTHEEAQRKAMEKIARDKADKERAEKIAAAKSAKEKLNKEQAEAAKVIKEKHNQTSADNFGARVQNDANSKSQANKDNFLDSPSGSRQDKSIGDMLDAHAERPMIQKRLERERAIYRNTAAVACQSTMRDVDACYAKTNCKRPEERPSANQCSLIPPYPQKLLQIVLTRVSEPGDVCYRENAECRAARAEGERRKERENAELERQQSQWESSYGSLKKECQQRSKERDEFASCQKQYGSTCNPNGFEGQNACIEHRMSTSGPTEQQARDLLKKEWDAKARADKSVPAGKKATSGTNFLD